MLRLHGLRLHTPESLTNRRSMVSIQSGRHHQNGDSSLRSSTNKVLASVKNTITYRYLDRKKHIRKLAKKRERYRHPETVEEHGRVSAISEIILWFPKISSELSQQFDYTPEFGNPAQHDHRPSSEPSFAAQDRPAP